MGAATDTVDNEALVERALDVLESVHDPEIPVLTISDLGILRRVEATDEGVRVVISPTYSGCPAMDTIEKDVRRVMQESGIAAEVKTEVNPPWTTDWITERGRQRMLEYGIAPPHGKSSDKRSLMGLDPTVACPQCRSTRTQMLSAFGSTACKALYRCEDCMETFDYFKCL